MERKTKILIVGNGFGGVYVLRNLHKYFHGNKQVEIFLVGEKNYFLFTPLLHEVATGGINPANIIEPIRKVMRCCLSDFYLGRVSKINLAARVAEVGKLAISYDYLVLAPGAETNFFNTPGAEKYCFTLKNIDDALKIKNYVISQMERASHTKDREARKKMLRFAIVGGGPTGVEFSAELAELVGESFSYYYDPELIKDASVVLIQKGPDLVPQFSPRTRSKSLEVLSRKGVKVMLHSGVKEVDVASITLDNGQKLPTEMVVWTAGIKPVKIDFDTAVTQTPGGRIFVNEFLQMENHPEVYVIGDMSAFKNKNSLLPALAQVAEKQAATAARNIALGLRGRKLDTFVYHSSGNLMSLGEWMAVGEISTFVFSGRFAWWFWRTVYLSKLISFRKRVKVAIDWTVNIFSPRDISQM